MSLDHPCIERERRIDYRKLRVFSGEFQRTPTTPAADWGACAPSRFLDAGDSSGVSGLGFGLDCSCRRDIVKLAGLLASRSSVHHQPSFNKEFREN